MGAQADMRRRSDLLSSFHTETHESSKKTMQSGLSSANIVVLNQSGGEQAVRRPVGVRADTSTKIC